MFAGIRPDRRSWFTHRLENSSRRNRSRRKSTFPSDKQCFFASEVHRSSIEFAGWIRPVRTSPVCRKWSSPIDNLVSHWTRISSGRCAYRIWYWFDQGIFKHVRDVTPADHFHSFFSSSTQWTLAVLQKEKKKDTQWPFTFHYTSEVSHHRLTTNDAASTES